MNGQRKTAAAMSGTGGFTLVELAVTMGLFTIVGVLGFMAIISSTQAMNTANTTATVQANVREVLMLMSSELELAAKVGDDSLDPPLEPVEVVANPAPNSPTEIAFQVPANQSGLNWTRRIRYRFVNEDANNNARLDAGEDANGDGQLTRRIFRVQDADGDGAINQSDPREYRPLGASNDISDANFTVNDGVVAITISAARNPDMKNNHGEETPHLINATVTGRVYLAN